MAGDARRRRPEGLGGWRSRRRRAQQPPAPDLHYLFAPLKQARLDYMVQKAVEMGAGRLRPVLTRHTQVTRLNAERMEANAIEAAEQCGILSLPRVDAPVALDALLAGWNGTDDARRIVFCDEGEPGADPVAILPRLPLGPLAVLVGPEGGFSEDERRAAPRRAVRHGPAARPPHPAGRHRRRRRPGAGPGRPGGLAKRRARPRLGGPD